MTAIPMTAIRCYTPPAVCTVPSLLDPIRTLDALDVSSPASLLPPSLCHVWLQFDCLAKLPRELRPLL